jgi:hypothetical protein
MFYQRLQLGVNAQDVTDNPGAGHLMQVAKGLHAESLGLEAFVEAIEKIQKLRVLEFVLVMGRAAVTFHALFLKAKMVFGVLLKKIHQTGGKLDFLRRRSSRLQDGFQLIDIENQHFVLTINAF